jgi:ATPase subunit of ABC transporter with duplicated ATPase domains
VPSCRFHIVGWFPDSEGRFYEPDSVGQRVHAVREHARTTRVLESLDLNDTVTHAVNVMKLAFYAPRKKVNPFLSMFRFSKMYRTQKIGTLSGGQRARVALALRPDARALRTVEAATG